MNRFHLAGWLGVLAAPLPLVAVHVSWMLKKEHYHYLPALVLALGLLLINRWDRVVRAPNSKSSLALVVTGFATLVVACWFYSPWLGAVAFVCALGGFLFAQRSTDGYSLSVLWPLSWMLIPLPLNLDEELVAFLQLHSSRLASYYLDLLHIPHVLHGNVIELTSGRLFVAQACSGIQSLFALVFAGITVHVALKRPSLLLPIYIAAGLFWAGVLNVVRLLTIAAVREWQGWDWSEGWKHSLLGYVCLAVAVALLLSTDRFIRVFFYPTNPLADRRKRPNPLVTAWNAAFKPLPTGEEGVRERSRTSKTLIERPAFLLVIAVAGLGCLAAQAATLLQVEPRVSALPTEKGTFFSPPEQLAAEGVSRSFVQQKYEQQHGSSELPMGENSDIWRGEFDGIPVTIAVSQPYREWHDLNACYTGVGWTLNHQVRMRPLAAEVGQWDCTQSQWLSPSSGYGYLWYSAFDELGQPVSNPTQSLLQRLLSVEHGPIASNFDRRVAMVQLVVETDVMLAPDAIERLEKLHLSTREYFRKLVAVQHSLTVQ